MKTTEIRLQIPTNWLKVIQRLRKQEAETLGRVPSQKEFITELIRKVVNQ